MICVGGNSLPAHQRGWWEEPMKKCAPEVAAIPRKFRENFFLALVPKNENRKLL
jgi:hypothetical protein